MAVACPRAADPPTPVIPISSAAPTAPVAPPSPCQDVSGCEPRCRAGENEACLRGAEAALCIDDIEDRRRAAALLDVACRRASPAACRELALLLDGRVEVAGRDPEKLLVAACSARDAAGCFHLVYVDREAFGEPVARHRVVLEEVCAGDFLDGCSALEALLAADDPVNGGSRDPKGAKAAREAVLRLARPRCQGGDEVACDRAADALLSFDGRTAERRERAREERLRGLAIRERKCEAGDGPACYAVASELRAAELVPRDPARARALTLRACEGGVADACKTVASDAELGRGGAVDPARMEAFLERACELCDADACRSVAARSQRAGRPFVDPRKKRRGPGPVQ